MAESKFCNKCPRKLKHFPNSPCEHALRTIDSVESGGPLEGPSLCPWFVTDPGSSYCFWLWLDQNGTVEDDKTAAILLATSTHDVRAALKSAINKLKRCHLGTLKDMAADAMRICSIDSAADMQAELCLESTNRSETPSSSHLRGFSGGAATHRSGRWTQLYGLSPNWFKNAQKFKEDGTPIKLSRYELRSERNEKVNKANSKSKQSGKVAKRKRARRK
jgi:hypothetical protein